MIRYFFSNPSFYRFMSATNSPFSWHRRRPLNNSCALTRTLLAPWLPWMNTEVCFLLVRLVRLVLVVLVVLVVRLVLVVLVVLITNRESTLFFLRPLLFECIFCLCLRHVSERVTIGPSFLLFLTSSRSPLTRTSLVLIIVVFLWTGC